MTSDGLYVRSGLETNAFFGRDVVIGDPNYAHTYISNNNIAMTTSEGVKAIDVSVSEDRVYRWIEKSLAIGYDTPTVPESSSEYFSVVPVSANISANNPLYIRMDIKYYVNQNGQIIVKEDTVEAEHDGGAYYSDVTYTEYDQASGLDVVRTIKVGWDIMTPAVIEVVNPSPNFHLKVTHLRYYAEAGVPDTVITGYCTIGGVELDGFFNDASKLSQDDIELYPYTTGQTPRCSLSADSGAMKVGNWGFVQLELTVNSRLSANQSYEIARGLPGYPAQNSSPPGALSVIVDASTITEPISAVIEDGVLTLLTPNAALASGTVLYITGWYYCS